LRNSTPAGGPTSTTRELTAQRLRASGVSQLMDRLSRRAGVPCSPHAFRRTCALELHRSGARLTEIASILGHSDLPTLQRYLDLQAADIASAHRQHSPVKALLGAGG
jgi:site-specific recombinase XerD